MKLKSFILILITLSIILLSFGCSKKEPMNEATNDVATFNVLNGEEVVLYDYDELSDFQEINATQAFGITRINTEAKYVKTGTGSMYVKVEGYEEMYHHPEKVSVSKQVIEMYPNWYFSQRGDFGDALCFKLDVYNISDRDVEIGLYIEAGNTKVVLGPEIALRNRWTELVFEVDREKAFYWGMDSINKIQFAFEGRTEGQSCAELYLDNFRYVKAEGKAIPLGYVPEQKGNVLCDFEDKYFLTTTMQTYNAYPAAGPFAAPKYEWNADKNYVTSGDYSLKITRYLNSYQNSMIPVYAENTILTTEYLKQVDFTMYDRNTHVIAMDVYNDCSDNVKMRFDIYDGNKQLLATDIRLEPNQWSTVEIPMNKTFLNWKNLIAVRILFPDWFGSENCVIYIDNIRCQPKAA